LVLALVLLVTVGATGAQAQAAADVWEPGPVNRTPVGGPAPAAADGARPDGGGMVAELEGRRTAESKTFRLADGGLQTVVNAERVHYKDKDGRWQPIDLTLVDGSSGGKKKHKTRPASTRRSPPTPPAPTPTRWRWRSSRRHRTCGCG